MAWTEVVGVPTKAVEFYRYTKEFSIAIPLPDSQLAPNNVLNILSTRNLKDCDILIFPIAGVSDIDGVRVEDCCLFVDVVDQDGTLHLVPRNETFIESKIRQQDPLLSNCVIVSRDQPFDDVVFEVQGELESESRFWIKPYDDSGRWRPFFRVDSIPLHCQTTGQLEWKIVEAVTEGQVGKIRDLFYCIIPTSGSCTSQQPLSVDLWDIEDQWLPYYFDYGIDPQPLSSVIALTDKSQIDSLQTGDRFWMKVEVGQKFDIVANAVGYDQIPNASYIFDYANLIVTESGWESATIYQIYFQAVVYEVTGRSEDGHNLFTGIGSALGSIDHMYSSQIMMDTYKVLT